MKDVQLHGRKIDGIFVLKILLQLFLTQTSQVHSVKIDPAIYIRIHKNFGR
jgi:hypothetical protein